MCFYIYKYKNIHRNQKYENSEICMCICNTPYNDNSLNV